MSYEFEVEELEVRKGTEPIYLYVTFEVADYHIANDGIGAYEFWGAKGVDRGTDFVEEFTISEVWVYSERRKKNVTVSKRLKDKIIELLYKDDKLAERINDKIMDDLNSEPDCPDC